MADRDLSLALRLYADSARFVNGLMSGERGVQRFGSGVRREFDSIRRATSSIQGQLAALGVSVGAVATVAQSGRLDKSLIQIRQTAGAAKTEIEGVRHELFSMANETGAPVDALKDSFNNAVQAGYGLQEALNITKATNVAMAVTGAAADGLAGSLGVAGTAFKFDLSKPEMATELLDKMTVAGRLGNAELENLSGIFGRLGVNASDANFSFEQTLAFIEGLSQVERAPERLATLADSTLRLFTNRNYLEAAQKATRVDFFETDGSRRDPLAVLRDIKKEYDKLGTDKQRSLFMQKAFGQADLDTIKGLRTLFGGDMLNKVDQFSQQIATAGGTLKNDLADALDNSVDQVGRLRSELRSAADGFARPINDTLAQFIKFTLDKKENGGLGMDGSDLLLGGAGLAVGTLAAARYGGKGISALAKRFGGTAAGVAEGKALEAAAGVTPVFVVNWPGGGMSGPGSLAADAAAAAAGGSAARTVGKARSLAVLAGGLPVSAWAGMGTAGLATAGAGVAAAGAGGYAVGSYVINPIINAVTSWATGRDQSLGEWIYDALHKDTEPQKLDGKIQIEVSQDGQVTSVHATSKTPGVDLNADAGMYMAGA